MRTLQRLVGLALLFFCMWALCDRMIHHWKTGQGLMSSYQQQRAWKKKMRARMAKTFSTDGSQSPGQLQRVSSGLFNAGKRIARGFAEATGSPKASHPLAPMPAPDQA